MNALKHKMWARKYTTQ